MLTSSLPRDKIQPMKAALRNSNENIRKHRQLRLQVPGKVSIESRPMQVKHVFNFDMLTVECVQISTSAELSAKGTTKQTINENQETSAGSVFNSPDNQSTIHTHFYKYNYEMPYQPRWAKGK